VAIEILKNQKKNAAQKQKKKKKKKKKSCEKRTGGTKTKLWVPRGNVCGSEDKIR